MASQAVLADMMARHRAEGGLVIAATHQALGLEDAQELRIEAAKPADRAKDGSAKNISAEEVWW